MLQQHQLQYQQHQQAALAEIPSVTARPFTEPSGSLVPLPLFAASCHPLASATFVEPQPDSIRSPCLWAPFQDLSVVTQMPMPLPAPMELAAGVSLCASPAWEQPWDALCASPAWEVPWNARQSEAAAARAAACSSQCGNAAGGNAADAVPLTSLARGVGGALVRFAPPALPEHLSSSSSSLSSPHSPFPQSAAAPSQAVLWGEAVPRGMPSLPLSPTSPFAPIAPRGALGHWDAGGMVQLAVPLAVPFVDTALYGAEGIGSIAQGIVSLGAVPQLVANGAKPLC